MKQPKMVKAWAFAWMMQHKYAPIPMTYVARSESEAETSRKYWKSKGYHEVGPIVRISVPAPKEASK